ncbi:hypothetical protein ACFL3T_04000, partial [Patescibacteria group bacterium]
MLNKLLQTATVIVLLASLTCTASANYNAMMVLPSEDDNAQFLYNYNKEETDVPPTAALRVMNDSGNPDYLYGTTATEFTFDAN